MKLNYEGNIDVVIVFNLYQANYIPQLDKIVRCIVKVCIS